MDPAAQQKLEDLQILEQNLQAILMQKQNFQIELNEVLNALEEVKKTNDTIYRMVGSIMVVVDKKKTMDELDEKKKILELRSDSIAKQERIIESKARVLQEEIKKMLEGKSPSTTK